MFGYIIKSDSLMSCNGNQNEGKPDVLYRYSFIDWIERFLQNGKISGDLGFISFSENKERKEYAVHPENLPLVVFDRAMLERYAKLVKIDYETVADEDREMALYVTGYSEQEFFNHYGLDRGWDTDYWWEDLAQLVSKFADEEEWTVDTREKPLIYRKGLITEIGDLIERKGIPHVIDDDV